MTLTMRSIALGAALALVAAGGSRVSFAAEQTWTGVLTDSTCGVSHAKMAQGLFTDKECTAACAEMGNYAILLAGDKVVVIATKNDDLKAHGGDKVKITGDLNAAGQIVVTKVEEVKN
jgi:hypothetical protein